jgi:hypothetical protein
VTEKGTEKEGDKEREGERRKREGERRKKRGEKECES